MAPKKRKHVLNPTDKRVGTQVRMRRLMLGMSQTELGERVGVSFQQIQKYEKGTNRISSSRLQQFATILKTPAASFFGDETRSDKGQIEITEFFATNEGLSLAKCFMKIKDPKVRRQIVALVEDLV